MYRNLTYFKDFHVLAKVISAIFGVWGICFTQNLYLLVLFEIFFFLFFRNTFFFLLSVVFFLLSFWYSACLIFMKICMIFSIVSLLIQTVHFAEIRSFLEYFFYRKKHSKIIYFSLYVCYFIKYYRVYFKEFSSLRKSYGKRWSFSFLKYVFVESLEKTKSKLHKVLLSYQYRFYNCMNHRTSIDNVKITAVDLKYISTVAMIVFMVYLYWR